jgi:hypothetical protein
MLFGQIVFAQQTTVQTSTPPAPPTTTRTTPPAVTAPVPPTPAVTDTNRDLSEEFRRARNTGRNTRRTVTERQGLLTMNLSGLETFGDALGNANATNTAITVNENVTIALNNGSLSGGVAKIFIPSYTGSPQIEITKDAASTSGRIYFDSGDLPSVTSGVIAHIGQLVLDTSAARSDTRVSTGLIEFLKNNNTLDQTLLKLNSDQSYADFNASNFQSGQILYNYYAQYDIPTPTSGAVYGLGRQKISENMSPLPTDRWIFDYSYFHNVPLPYRNMAVNRFTPGIEKTFFGKRFSLEARLPMATTIDNKMYTDNVNSLNVLKIGDLTVSLKFLLFQRERLALTAGLGISVPFADDSHLYDRESGREFIRRKNETYHLMPYLGLLYLPGEQTFFQMYFQIDGSTRGDSTYAADLASAGNKMIALGKTYERSFAYTSLALGYWLYRQHDSKNRTKRGINLIGELHWTQSLDRAHGVQYDYGNYRFNIGKDTGNYSVLNTTIGSRFILNSKTNIGVGYSVPLSNQKQFDGELRLTCNRYF